MKKTKFTLYGLLLGAACAAYGSAIFAALLIFIFYGFNIVNMNPFDVFMNFVFATLFCAMYSALPGALGGLYLARWLTPSERTPQEVRRRGLIVGAAAGLAISAFVSSVILQFNVDLSTLGYAVLATLVAAGMSWLAARLLAKDRKKFVVTNQT